MKKKNNIKNKTQQKNGEKDDNIKKDKIKIFSEKPIKKTESKKVFSLGQEMQQKMVEEDDDIKSKLKIFKKRISEKPLLKKTKKKDKKDSVLKPRLGKIKQIAKKRTKPFIQPSQLYQLITKHIEGPIISPRVENDWEWHVFNPGTILLEDKVHFLYRAQGEDWVSRLGYAVSDNGFEINERLLEPVYEHSPITGDSSFVSFSLASGGSFGGCEDPRIVRINKEDTLYMTYAACDQGIRMVLTSIKVKDFLNRKWRWKSPVFISPPRQVQKNWVLFPEKIKGRYAILHSINPQISVDYFDNLNFDGKNYINSYYHPEPKGSHWSWETWIRGVGPSPIKTKDGWLIFYHALGRQDFGKYKVGVMLLDSEEPTKILRHSNEPILEASELYESIGFKPGVIYITGAVVKNDNLLLYYGSSDSYVCVAYVNFEEFLTALKKEVKSPKAKQKILKKIRW